MYGSSKRNQFDCSLIVLSFLKDSLSINMFRNSITANSLRFPCSVLAFLHFLTKMDIDLSTSQAAVAPASLCVDDKEFLENLFIPAGFEAFQTISATEMLLKIGKRVKMFVNFKVLQHANAQSECLLSHLPVELVCVRLSQQNGRRLVPWGPCVVYGTVVDGGCLVADDVFRIEGPIALANLKEENGRLEIRLIPKERLGGYGCFK